MTGKELLVQLSKLTEGELKKPVWVIQGGPLIWEEHKSRHQCIYLKED